MKAPTEACAGATFEVDLVNSGKNKAFDANYDWRVQKSTLKVEKVNVTDLGDAGVEGIASFTLQPVLDSENKPVNLCVHVVDQL